MKDNYTEIAIILDRSGSMHQTAGDTIGGYNKFIADQKLVPGEAKISLYQFNAVYEPTYEGLDVKEAKDLTAETYRPNGNTALLDAIGKTINSLGTRLKNMPEDARPGKVIVAIITDGEENISQEFTKDVVFELIKQQQDVYKWGFVFLAANQDAIKAGGSFGINAGSTMTYAQTKKGLSATYDSFSGSVAHLRASAGTTYDFMAKEAFFSGKDRAAQEKELQLKS